MAQFNYIIKKKHKNEKINIYRFYIFYMPKKFFKRAARAVGRAVGGAARVAMPVVKGVAMAKGRKFLGAVAPALHRAIDSKVDRLSNSIISKISGQGDYTTEIKDIVHNTLIRPTMDDNIPQFGHMKGGIRVTHREYIGDLKSSGAFKNTVYRINPALKETFPWLSQLATNFERYRFLGLCFEFKSGSSDALNSTNTALGYVVMASQYNSLSDAFVNKQQMENTQYCVSVKPSKSVIHPIECDPALQPAPVLYTRLASVGEPSKGDLRLYDWAQEEVAVVGMQADDVNLGELWVSYDVMLYLPVLSSGLALDALTAHYSLKDIIDDTTDIPKSIGVGFNPVVLFDNLGGTFTQSGNVAARFQFPKGSNGKYLINYRWEGIEGAQPDDSLVYLDVSNINNTQLLTCWASDTGPNNRMRYRAYRAATPTTNSLFEITFQCVVNILNPNLDAIIEFNIPTIASTLIKNPSYGDIVITQINGNYQ